MTIISVIVGNFGFYPSDYVEILSDIKPAPPPPPPPPKKKATIQGIVLHDFVPTTPQTMALKKGDIIEILTKGSAGGWSVGLSGAFPTDYVEFMSTEVAPIREVENGNSSVLRVEEKQVAATAPANSPLNNALNGNNESKFDNFLPEQSESKQIPPRQLVSNSEAKLGPQLSHGQQPRKSISLVLDNSKLRRKTAFSNIAAPSSTLDGSSFVIARPGKTETNAVWRQYVFMDLFADYYLSQMVQPKDQQKIPAATRLRNALSLCKTAISYIDANEITNTLSENGFSVVNVCGDINAALGEAIDFCDRLPVQSSDPNKFFSFLTTFMARVRTIQGDGILLVPVTWTRSEGTPFEHGILLLLHRVKDNNSDNEFSVSVINTSIDEGLNMHGMHADNSDASIIFNIAFVLKDIPNSKIYNSTFW